MTQESKALWIQFPLLVAELLLALLGKFVWMRISYSSGEVAISECSFISLTPPTYANFFPWIFLLTLVSAIIALVGWRQGKQSQYPGKRLRTMSLLALICLCLPLFTKALAINPGYVAIMVLEALRLVHTLLLMKKGKGQPA